MRDTDNEAEGLTILGALAQLKEDIRQIQEKDIKRGRAPMFLIHEGELELKLTVAKDIKAEAKGIAKFKLILAGEASVGTSGAVSRESLQTLRIKFRALSPKESEEYASVENHKLPNIELTQPVVFMGESTTTTKQRYGQDYHMRPRRAEPMVSSEVPKRPRGSTLIKKR